MGFVDDGDGLVVVADDLIEHPKRVPMEATEDELVLLLARNALKVLGDLLVGGVDLRRSKIALVLAHCLCRPLAPRRRLREYRHKLLVSAEEGDNARVKRHFAPLGNQRIAGNQRVARLERAPGLLRVRRQGRKRGAAVHARGIVFA